MVIRIDWMVYLWKNSTHNEIQTNKQAVSNKQKIWSEKIGSNENFIPSVFILKQFTCEMNKVLICMLRGGEG